MTPLEQAFPALAVGGYRLTSPEDWRYNCIAWAATDSEAWWWPDPSGGDRWPDGVPRVETLEAFTAAFATLGFVPTSSSEFAAGFERVALYAIGGKPTHAARQLPSGRWTSKLGSGFDIEHDLAGLEGSIYGAISLLLERPTSVTAELP